MADSSANVPERESLAPPETNNANDRLTPSPVRPDTAHQPEEPEGPDTAVFSPPEGSETPALPVSAVERSPYFGAYHLLAELAHGGMGVVYRAWDTKLERYVALKTIRAGQLASDQEVQRFYQEARAAAHLDHPGIVPVYEVGEHDGQHYYVMGLVEGGSLARRIRQRPLPPREAVAILKRVVEAVEYAHRQGVIHRDLKPGNILLDKDGQPKVTDFGVAKMVRQDSELTIAGQVLGTPSYMSPEQAAGKSLDAGPAADVYSLGATLYCLLTGRPPFHASRTLETLKQVLEQEPVSPRQLNPSVSRDLETICLKCLEKEPAKRYRSAAALAEDLGHWLAGEPIKGRPVSWVERQWRWCRRNPAVSILSGLVVLSLLLGTAISIAYALEAQHAAARADAAREQSEARLHDAEVQLAFIDWKAAQITLAMQRLQRLVPAPGAVDLRGFEWYYMQRLCRLEVRSLRGHATDTRTLAFSPNGRLLASGGMDHIVRILDTATGQELRKLFRHSASIRSLAFSPDGRWLASASEDRTVILWDTETWEGVRVLEGHSGTVRSVAFRPDSQRLATASLDEVRIWSLHEDRPPIHWSAGQRNVMSVAFSADGQRLATAGSDATVKIWGADTGTQLACLPGHTDSVYSVAFSPNGRWLGSAGRDKSAIVWDLAQGHVVATLHGHGDTLQSVAFSPDSCRLATASNDGTVRVWEAATGKQVLTLRGHELPVNKVVFSPDGWRLASADAGGTIKLWDATATQETTSLRVEARNIARVVFSPTGAYLAAAVDRVIQVWDVRTGIPLTALRGHTRKVWGIAFSPDGRQLASVSGDCDPGTRPARGELKLWDVASGKELPSLGDRAGLATAVAFSPDGRRLATAGLKDVARVWDLATGEEALTLRGPKGRILDIAFSPDGRLLAGAGEDGTVRAWDAANGQEAPAPAGHSKRAWRLAFSSDSRLLATVSADTTARVWSVATGELLFTLRGHRDEVHGVAFSSDGRRLATATLRGEVKVWDLLTGQEVLSLGHAGDFYYDAAISPDGNRLAVAATRGLTQRETCSWSCEVLIWDASPLTPDLLPEREAGSLVRFLFARPLLRREVLEEIEHQRTISDEVRRHARAVAENYPEDARRFQEVARCVVRRPDAAGGEYRLALRQAETACRLAPENGEYLTTRGMAQYRLRNYAAAIDTLSQAEKLLAGSLSPANLAFLAMTQHRLGLKEQAKATLQRLRAAPLDDSETRALLSEAEARLAAVELPGP
jgi:WD40 repeat protein/tRNA A-37 threonylcarbamoyl transferase component Bud32